ncbi:acyl-coenzyme A synthetase/AMP-(fatty) acid ligase [Leucobacter exalbidus]|uniref:Acyl-coenzyme A synthetase/AMP-(Fatty) acid ligase n=1 Tax=Leucobacter exalbidus TaxID=662960 RepID=A0A940PS65_9MICO|nr:fatty acid--CoA ligase family protein [Leucobacter exalbidus]MBP1325798.1 acyl-coenzyme A synthetase/AMP-(fatty) acid ligase [Leucobacter exalbidus]
MPITGAILETAAQCPDRVAIAGSGGAAALDEVRGHERLTYAELVADSARMFAVIDALHRGQTEPPTPAPETGGIAVTAVSADSAFLAGRIVAGLAGFRAVSAVIDPRWPLAHRVDVILTTGIGVVISAADDLEPALRARGWGGTVIAPMEFARLVRLTDLQQDAPQPTVRDGDEAFLLLFSSGTTSNPKAFVKTRAQYRANLAVSTAHLAPLPGVVTLAPGPVSYSLTLYAVIECMATGGSVHLADQFDAFGLASRVIAEGITRVVAVPAVVQGIAVAARRNPQAFAGLELVVTGGANLPASIRTALAASVPGARLISYYGAAEIGFIGDSREGDGTRVSLYGGVQASVRDTDSGAPVPEGEPGTLWIHAAACSLGYVAGTTAERLVGDDGWATVHDQARIIDGQLELLGRAGDIAITGGHKVSLLEVERAFEATGDQAEAAAVCAVALPHPTLGSVIGLVVEGEAPSRDALRAHAEAHLAPQFVPTRWYRMNQLPRTVSGKIRRGETCDLVIAGEAERL